MNLHIPGRLLLLFDDLLQRNADPDDEDEFDAYFDRLDE